MYLCGQRSLLKALNLAAFYGSSCSLWPDLWLISGQITPGDPGQPGLTWCHGPSAGVSGEWPRPGLSPLVTTEEGQHGEGVTWGEDHDMDSTSSDPPDPGYCRSARI